MSSEKPEHQPKKHATGSQETSSASASYHIQYAVFAATLEAESSDLERFKKSVKMFRAMLVYENCPREFSDRALMYLHTKLSKARAALQETCLGQGTKRALDEVIDTAINLGVQAAISPDSKEYFFAEIQSDRGKKSSKARAKKGRWWVPRASRLIVELWRTRRSEPGIAEDVSLKLSDEEGRTVSQKTLLRHIQSMKNAGELQPRRNMTANRSKQPASRPDSA